MAANSGSGWLGRSCWPAGSQASAYRDRRAERVQVDGGRLRLPPRRQADRQHPSAGGISTATVTGTCPYCGDDVNFSEVLDAVTGESMGTLGWRGTQPAQTDDGYMPLTVSCCCTAQHAGRPAGISHGCGINFHVEVRRDA